MNIILWIMIAIPGGLSIYFDNTSAAIIVSTIAILISLNGCTITGKIEEPKEED